MLVPKRDFVGLEKIGLLLFPGAISAVFFGPIAGTLADRRGNTFVVLIGLLLLTARMVVMALLLGLSALVVGAALLLTNIGFTMFQIALVNSVSQTLPDHETGTGTALVGKVLAGECNTNPRSDVKERKRVFVEGLPSTPLRRAA